MLIEVTDNQKEIEQGDIVRLLNFPQLDEPVPALCLSPACDLIQQKNGKRKANFVLFTPIFPEDIFFANVLLNDYRIDISKLESGDISTINNNKKTVHDFVKRIIGDENMRYYWIYDDINKKGYVTDFQVAVSIPYNKTPELEILYSLVSSYKERAATKYSSYIGRVGTADIDEKTHITNRLSFYNIKFKD